MELESVTSFSKKTLQDYEVISVLGSGSFGTCYKVRDKQTDKLYAWKAIDYDELDDLKLESLVSEISVLRQLQHPNIVQYYHHLNSHEAKSIFIIMEWCEGGDLSQLIFRARTSNKRFEEKYIWRVLFQLCKALQVCHSKLEQGTVLHRDIKPANIFLDTSGNAKLGDFGLARMLRCNQSFTNTLVGTPYYMSPEIIKGSHYDCRSDVWALGCLTYEMAALVPPFRGRKLTQLSDNITKGKYAEISQVYSKDLRDIIHFMLEVSEKQRPCVEMVVRHPNLVRNIDQQPFSFEPLVEAETNFLFLGDNIPRTRLQYSQSSLVSSMDNSCYEDPQHLGGFTPDMRSSSFYSGNRKLCHRMLQQSDSELYKSSRHYEKHTDNQTEALKPESVESPQKLTENIFNSFIQDRLRAVRAQESLLKLKEENLAALEQKLMEKERRLCELECRLDKMNSSIENKLRVLKPKNTGKNLNEVKCNIRTSSKNNRKRSSVISVVPQKQSTSPDGTYCSIEIQDKQSPTVAKLDLASLPSMKPFPASRKVTFLSPKRIITYDIENIPPQLSSQPNLKRPNKLRNSVCSSSDGSASDNTTQRRKSLLSILGFNRGNKESSKDSFSSHVNQQQQQERRRDILSQCEPEKLTNIWTKENKRAAFDLLAAMKASKDSKQLSSCGVRQSLRESKRGSLRRDGMRQSLKIELA